LQALDSGCDGNFKRGGRTHAATLRDVPAKYNVHTFKLEPVIFEHAKDAHQVVGPLLIVVELQRIKRGFKPFFIVHRVELEPVITAVFRDNDYLPVNSAWKNEPEVVIGMSADDIYAPGAQKTRGFLDSG